MNERKILADHGVCWRDGNGNIYRRRIGKSLDSKYPFEMYMDNYWTKSHLAGFAPYTECPDPSRPKVEPKRGLEAFEWSARKQLPLQDEKGRLYSVVLKNERLSAISGYRRGENPYNIAFGLDWPMNVDLVPADGREW